MARFSTLWQRWVCLPVSAAFPGPAGTAAPARGRRTPFLLAAALALAPGGARACADLALVLAIDASGSISPAEFALQQQGYAQAFRSRPVQAALAAAGVVDVAVVLWADSAQVPQVLPFARLRNAGDAQALADRIAGLPRKVTGSTGIGRGVQTALDLLAAPGACAQRRIVNLSGDGVETQAPRQPGFLPLSMARDQAGLARVTINALAIRSGPDDLGAWYAERLITGPGAFVMQVDGFDGFGAAIQAKLVREIAPPAVAALAP
jgi:hypothetical protein